MHALQTEEWLSASESPVSERGFHFYRRFMGDMDLSKRVAMRFDALGEEW